MLGGEHGRAGEANSGGLKSYLCEERCKDSGLCVPRCSLAIQK